MQIVVMSARVANDENAAMSSISPCGMEKVGHNCLNMVTKCLALPCGPGVEAGHGRDKDLNGCGW